MLRKGNRWGAITVEGKTFIPFEEISPIYFFRKASCYGTQVKEGTGIYSKLNKNKEYLGSFTIIDFNGNVIESYDWMRDECKGSCLIYDSESEKYGIINSFVDTVAEFRYQCTSWDDKNFGFSDRGFIALKDPEKKCGIISYKGKVVMPFAYDYIDDLVFPTALIEKDEKWGLLNNKDLRIKVPIRYDDIKCSSNSIDGDYLTAFAKDSTGWDVYDSAFHRLGHYTFEDMESRLSHPNMIIIQQNGKYGLYDFTKDKFFRPAIYEKIDFECWKDCKGGAAVLLYTADSIFILDTKGKNINSLPGIDNGSLFNNYSSLRQPDGSYRLLKNYQMALPDTFDYISNIFIDRDHPTKYFIAVKNGLYGVCDTLGNIIIPYKYDKIDYDRNQVYFLVSAERDSAFDCYDADMKLINDQPFEIYTWLWRPYSTDKESRNLVRCNGKYGFFDFKTKQFVIKPEYQDYKYVQDYNYNSKEINYYINLLGKGKVTWIDDQLKIVFTVNGQEVRPTYDPGKIILVNNDKSYLADLTGKIISKPYDSLACIGNDARMLVVKEKNKYGIITIDGKKVYKTQYTRFCNSIETFKDYGYACMLAQPKKAIYLDSTGAMIRSEEGDYYWFYCPGRSNY